MPSLVRCTSSTAPAIMLIEAMVRESKDADLMEKFGVPQVPCVGDVVKVCLTINGVEVDYVKTAKEMWDRLVSQHEKHVKEKALEILNGSRLQRLGDILTNAEWQLEEEIEKLFKEKS